MARIGQNPARDRKSDYAPADVTIAVVVHIPALVGYHSQRFDILKMSLGSLFRHTSSDYDLMIFDNGCCQEVGDYLENLKSTGSLRFLLSVRENIGKMGAFQVLFRAAPGNILAYSDDDIFFYPGWLERHLEILTTFPRVGMVSGLPALAGIDSRVKGTMNLIKENPQITVKTGQIPREWQVDFALSTGRDPQQWMDRCAEEPPLIAEFDGKRAFISAAHFQFVGYKDVLIRALPESWSGQLMREMRFLDEGIDALGYMRLSTTERVVRHMGNILDESWQKEAERLDIDLAARKSKSSLGKWARCLLQVPGIRWILQGLYNRLFWLLSARG